MADVFISYARPNQAAARRIAERLRDSGRSVWFDEELPANRAYADVISEKLDESKAVVVLWSEQGAASQWVRSEADRARSLGTLVQARLDGARLPMPFDQTHCLDFTGWDGDVRSASWRSLAATIDRLVEDSADAPVHPTAPVAGQGGPSRRQALIGAGAAVSVAALAALGWRQFAAEERVPPEVEVLIQKSLTIMQDSRPEEQDQAVAYLVEATRIAPNHARGWGLLAFIYALQKFHVPKAARAGSEMRCRSAARTALDLDGQDPFASCALVLLIPPYRNWMEVERLGRDAVKRFAYVPLPHHIVSDVLADVGRLREAVQAQAGIDRRNFLIPIGERRIIQTLWSAGAIQRAETLLTEAVERWPRHDAIWDLRVNFYTFSGQPDEAVRLLQNPDARPYSLPEVTIEPALLTAKAMAGSADRDAAIRANLEMLGKAPPEVQTYLNRKIATAQAVAQRCAALGDLDTAFALLDGYYFGRGQWRQLRPAAGDEDCSTATLFEPPMAVAMRDERFARLVREIGLERYWRTTGTRPDYRA